MRFGHCKNCYWWNECSYNKGICFMHTQSEDIITLENAYCPDFVNRKKYEKESGMTLKEWTEQNDFKGRYVNYMNYVVQN